MSLDPDDIDAIAVRVAEILARREETRAFRYLDARQLAAVLGVEREWVYAHAPQLGGVRLGGPRGRLRFDLQHTTRALATDPLADPAARPRRRRRHPSGGVDLLPYES